LSAFRQGLNAGHGCGGFERARPGGCVSSSRTVDPPVESTNHWAGNFFKKGERGWPDAGAAQVHSPRRKPTPADRTSCELAARATLMPLLEAALVSRDPARETIGPTWTRGNPAKAVGAARCAARSLRFYRAGGSFGGKYRDSDHVNLVSPVAYDGVVSPAPTTSPSAASTVVSEPKPSLPCVGSRWTFCFERLKQRASCPAGRELRVLPTRGLGLVSQKSRFSVPTRAQFTE
jgi:hypothetical protein